MPGILVAYHNGKIYKVRERTRAGRRETQVWLGRKIVYRTDTEEQAKDWIEGQPR